MDPVLYKAAMEGDIEVVKQMADQFEVQLTPNNNTALHVAAQFGQTQCVEEVLKKCSRSLLCSVNIEGETSLHISAREGHTNIVRALFGHGNTFERDPESGIGATMEMLRTRTVEGDTALFEAVRNNHPDVVEILTKEDPHFLHFPNNAKETPLYLAAERSNPDIVSRILKNCNSPAYIGPNGRTALHAATICDDEECIKMLHDWKPSLIKEADVYGWRPLHCAAFLGNTSKIKQLLLLDKDNSVAYLVADNDNNKTALHIAASQGHIDVMEALLLSCPDCWEMKSSKDQNILHIAIENDQEVEIIASILDKPYLISLLNQKDIDGNTPLHLLAAKSSKYLYEYLTQNLRGVDKRVCNKKDLTSSEVRDGILNPDQKKTQVRMVGYRSKFNSRKANDGKRFLAQLGRTAKNNLLVASLTATVSFAAGFTVPGGYDGNDGPNQGMAVLTRLAAFKAFVVTDALALIFSVSAVWIHIVANSYEDEDDRILGHGYALMFIFYAMVTMVIAFLTGIYAVWPNSSGFAIYVVALSSVYCVFALCYGLYLAPKIRKWWFTSNIRGRGLQRFTSKIRGCFRR